MNPQAKLEQMFEFISSDLKSKDFKLISTSNKNRFKLVKANTSRGLILLNKQLPLTELLSLHDHNKRDFGSSTIIFYKDGETFFRRMVENNSSWRSDKSLKKYSENEINQIIFLTIQERHANFGFSTYLVNNFTSKDLVDTKLIYYQPKTLKLEESIRKFNPGVVKFDYSHIKADDVRYNFVIDSISKTYFFLNEE